MAVKNAAAKAWDVSPSSDAKRWSAWPAGDKPSAGQPTLGAHAGAYQTVGAGSNPVTTPSRDTQASGSSLLIFSAFYLTEFGSLTHNKSGTINNVGQQAYTAWGPYGGRLDWVQSLVGGSGQTVSYSNSALYATDEKTLFMVEVKNGQTLITPSPLVAELPASAASVVTSNSVTTTGPAVVLCCAWGDANISNPMDMAVHADSIAEGWTQIEDITLNDTAHIQGSLAAREVSGAGTYSCKWNFTPAQRALFFIVAVQE